MTPLQQEVAAAFAPTGALAAVDPGYQLRPAQLEMALAVAETLEERSVLVAEAGTGVGKTFAYLVPVLISGARALISTATKSLQDQLYLRDLPRLSAALQLPLSAAMLKGRASYLCLHRLQLARQGAELPDHWAMRALAKVEKWAQATRTGDLAEMPGLDERSSIIPLVTSTRDNCLGSECAHFRDCHVFKARREAMLADLVVVNHHLFFADLNLRDTGVAELLPTVDAAVFDEAHQLPEAGVQFMGDSLGSAQIADFHRDLLGLALTQARGLAPWQDLISAGERAMQSWRLSCAGASSSLRSALKLRWTVCAGRADFREALTQLAQALGATSAALRNVMSISAEMTRLHDRAQGLVSKALAFAEPLPLDAVRWVELSSHHARMVESPLDIRQALREQIEGSPKAWLFTSATLGDDAGLSWFTQSAGLAHAPTLRACSPFDYARHARLFIPADFPLPGDAAHSAAVGTLAALCAQALEGRTFVLTTTLRALHDIAQALQAEFERLGSTVEVLRQGELPKRQLIEQFVGNPRCVLVGSQSFWEGIDVPGDALQCVLIDKLPFPPPNDPLVEARVRSLEDKGRDAFAEFFMAEAAVSLKQGAGRLIRSETDRGLLIVCDPRLVKMRYGKRLREALPPMPLLATQAQAMDWLFSLVALRTKPADSFHLPKVPPGF